jgi:Tfp pilus assembly protein PilN
VHLLDELVRQMPEGVYLKSIVQKGCASTRRLRAVKCARLDADAQHRSLALA